MNLICYVWEGNILYMINIPLKLTFPVRAVKVIGLGWVGLGQYKVGVKTKRFKLTVTTLIHGVTLHFGSPMNEPGNATTDQTI